LAIGLWLTYHLFAHRVLFTAVLGSAGYFFVALALFNLILLFCLNRAERALALLAVALVCNGVTGYVLSHLFGLEYAAIGLLVGGIVLFTMSHRVIKIVFREADYFYALA
jgi:O-antigen/teichoic acid export membrane protein